MYFYVANVSKVPVAFQFRFCVHRIIACVIFIVFKMKRNNDEISFNFCYITSIYKTDLIASSFCVVSFLLTTDTITFYGKNILTLIISFTFMVPVYDPEHLIFVSIDAKSASCS